MLPLKLDHLSRLRKVSSHWASYHSCLYFTYPPPSPVSGNARANACGLGRDLNWGNSRPQDEGKTSPSGELSMDKVVPWEGLGPGRNVWLLYHRRWWWADGNVFGISLLGDLDFAIHLRHARGEKNYDAPKMKFIAPADGSTFPKPKILSRLAGRSSSPEADAKDLLCYVPATYHTSPTLSLAPSLPSARWEYVPPARQTGLNPSQPSSPSSLPSSSPLSSSSTFPPSSPAWQPSPSVESTF